MSEDYRSWNQVTCLGCMKVMGLSPPNELIRDMKCVNCANQKHTFKKNTLVNYYD